jgi:hypothetical protein
MMIILTKADVFRKLLKGLNIKSKIKNMEMNEQMHTFLVTLVNMCKFNTSPI